MGEESSLARSLPLSASLCLRLVCFPCLPSLPRCSASVLCLRALPPCLLSSAPHLHALYIQAMLSRYNLESMQAREGAGAEREGMAVRSRARELERRERLDAWLSARGRPCI